MLPNQVSLSIHKVSTSIRNKTPRGYKNGTHVHSAFLRCALHLISRRFVLEDQRGWITCPRSCRPKTTRSHLNQRLPPRSVLSLVSHRKSLGRHKCRDCVLMTMTPPRGAMLCARAHIWVSGGCSEAALWLRLLWSITAISTVPLIIGNAGDFAFKQNLPYQHCWCVYKGVFLHLKPLS